MVWDELEEALEANATITGRISGKVKGGFTVDIKDVRAFLPGSLVDVRPVRDPVYLEGKELEFKIIKLDRKRNNVVVSRRAVVESEHSEEREQLLEKLAGRRDRHRRGQEPHRLRRVRGPRRHRWPAAHHRHGVEARAPSVRSGRSRQELEGPRAQVRPRAQPRFARPEAARRGSVGQHRPSLPDRHARVRQGLQRHRLRLLRRDRAGRRRPGARVRDGLDQQERQPVQGRAGRRRSRSHGAGRG
jgi:hypothetical protein